MAEPIDWAREIEETEAAYTQHLLDIFKRWQAQEEKRGISEVAVKKELPLGITKNIAPYIGKSKGGKKKTRRAGKKNTHLRTKHRK